MGSVHQSGQYGNSTLPRTEEINAGQYSNSTPLRTGEVSEGQCSNSTLLRTEEISAGQRREQNRSVQVSAAIQHH